MLKQRLKKENAITLIALVITIIVLLILVGISIASLTGDNGILTKATTAKEENKKIEYEEILKLIYDKLLADKLINSWDSKTFLDQFEKEIEKDENLKGVEIIRKDNETIQIVTKEKYVYQITENEVKYIGTQGKNPPPDLKEGNISFNLSSDKEYVNTDIIVEIVTNIEIGKNTLLYSTDGTTWKKYAQPITVEENCAIHAKLINDLGEMGKAATQNIKNIDKEEPNKAEITLSATTITTATELEVTVKQSDIGISGVDIENCKWVYSTKSEEIGTNEADYTGGRFKTEEETIIMKPKEGTGYIHVLTIDKAGNKKETISEPIQATYDANNISLLTGVEAINNSGYYDVIVNGQTYKTHIYYFEGNQTWSGTKTYGDANDVGTASGNASRMVVVKVNGDLTLSSGAILRPYSTAYGGPKGFFVYCTGKLTNNGGTIQNNFGAKAPGQNVYLWKNKSGSYEYIPSAGAVGGASVKCDLSGYVSRVGANGSAGSSRGTGGGGSGGIVTGEYGSGTLCSGAGSRGTSYSGGTGGGGAYYDGAVASAGVGNGGAGGNGSNVAKWTWGTGGGAGNPGGTHYSQAANGSNGTGGLLIIYANTFVNSGTIQANGAAGGWAYRAGGGGSGGGSINIFYKSKQALGTITANAGAGGNGTRSGGQTAKGGNGGAGIVTKGNISTGNFVKE